MKQQRFADPSTPRQRQISIIWGMIEDLKQAIDLLDCDIASQKQIGKRSESPRLATALTSRRYKLEQTLRTLEQRLTDLRGIKRS